jgi:hypothetical protein
MAAIIFINLGYGHEQFPAFLRACDDVRAGVDSPVRRMFVWSDTGADTMDRSLAPHFMNDIHGNWRWSERAQKFFWVKWEGERGGYHLPQFNFGDPGWQAETRRILDFWLRTGIDGVVIDAVNWSRGSSRAASTACRTTRSRSGGRTRTFCATRCAAVTRARSRRRCVPTATVSSRPAGCATSTRPSDPTGRRPSDCSRRRWWQLPASCSPSSAT